MATMIFEYPCGMKQTVHAATVKDDGHRCPLHGRRCGKPRNQTPLYDWRFTDQGGTYSAFGTYTAGKTPATVSMDDFLAGGLTSLVQRNGDRINLRVAAKCMHCPKYHGGEPHTAWVGLVSGKVRVEWWD